MDQNCNFCVQQGETNKQWNSSFRCQKEEKVFKIRVQPSTAFQLNLPEGGEYTAERRESV